MIRDSRARSRRRGGGRGRGVGKGGGGGERRAVPGVKGLGEGEEEEV